MRSRGTHTYVTLEVSDAAYTEIFNKLRAAGYDHALNEDGEIDMHGLALVPVKALPEPTWVGDEGGGP